MPDVNQDIKLVKLLANRGVCSRRQAADYIEDGRVKVDGELITNKAIRVEEDVVIHVDGKQVKAVKEPIVYLLYKPQGVLTTHQDTHDRPTVVDLFPKGQEQLRTVGRLDMNSEGLLLLTNDSGFKRFLELPQTGLARSYRVRAYGFYDKRKLKELSKGVEIEGVQYRPAQVEYERKVGGNHWFTMVLHEGKNREIRKLMEYAGLRVNRLIRTSYGPFKLGDLEKGEVMKVKFAYYKELYQQYQEQSQ